MTAAPHDRSEASSVGVVAIGRNEGERLKRCLRSALAHGGPVVYVDSGSSDGSAEFATSQGVELVELDTSEGFTAAKARNAGLERLLSLHPSIEYVQFVDGDCEIVDSWVEKAREFLEAQDQHAVVCGRRREIDADRNWYHRLADMEWDTPTGEAKYCGGDALMRVAALKQVDGYRDSLIAGEEPELCVRLRRAGWKIHRLDAEMTRHDIRMDSWRQWWKRAVRSGHAYAEGASLHGAPPERHWVRERRSILLWGMMVPLLSLALAWPTYGVSLVAAVALYGVMVLKVACATYQKRGCSLASSLVYGLSCMIAKAPQANGLLAYLLKPRTSKAPTIIEYRHAAS